MSRKRSPSEFPLESSLHELEEIRSQLADLPDTSSRIVYLKTKKPIVDFFEKNPQLEREMTLLSEEDQALFLEIIVSKKGEALFKEMDTLKETKGPLRSMIASIKPLYASLSPIGGILGYLILGLKIIGKKERGNKEIDPPPFISIEKKSKNLSHWIREGISALPLICEIYPIGGAGDRLGLKHGKTGSPLPQARLQFQGRSLLSGLIRDLEGREELYRKLYKKKIVTPVILMTSSEKDNRRHVEEILRENQFFGREEDSFFIFEQPQVPILDQKGFIQATGPFEMEMKPGGHGALWILLEKSGAFSWLQRKKRTKAIIRQINNPLAGIDYNLIALLGYGVSEKKEFGFLSCPRKEGAQEGSNVLLKSHNEDGDFFTITNLEYTETSEMSRVQMHPKLFPANANILFANLASIRQAVERVPLPGMIFNCKEGKCGRLESTMQNIADAFLDPATEGSSPQRTFVLVNKREKTLTVTKKSHILETPFEGTPVGAFFDVQKMWGTFLEKECASTLMPFHDPLSPSYIVDINPKLGPLFEVIRQKLQRLHFLNRAGIRIDVPDILIDQVVVEGSLLIEGASDSHCIFKNVKVTNKGIDFSKKADFWSGDYKRKGACRISLGKGSELIAENCELAGDRDIVVPDGHSLTIFEENGVQDFRLVKKSRISPLWEYSISSDNAITLTFMRNKKRIAAETLRNKEP